MTNSVAKLQEKFTNFIYNNTDIDFLDTSESECNDYRFDLDDGERSVWVRDCEGGPLLDGCLPTNIQKKFEKWAKTNKIKSEVNFA